MLHQNSVKQQLGQALVEHIVMWPLLVFFTLGVIQAAFLYRDKATVNNAVFLAAREGALNHSFKAPMNIKFIQALAPLYMNKYDRNVAGYFLAQGDAFLQNGVDPSSGAVIGAVPGMRIDIISPTRSVFTKFSKSMQSLPDGCELQTQRGSNGFRQTRCRETTFVEIPNDNLNIRGSATQRVNVAGAAVDLNIQDANLLKIKGYWCAPMIVPLVNKIIYSTSQLTGGASNPHWSACRNKTTANGLLGGWRIYYIPISSDSLIRMQSTVRCESDPVRGRATNCGNLI